MFGFYLFIFPCSTDSAGPHMVSARLILCAFMSQFVIMLFSTTYIWFVVDGQHNIDWYLLALDALVTSSFVRKFYFLGPFVNKNGQ